MTRYAATGPSRPLKRDEETFISEVVCELNDVGEFTTGCAFGVDTRAHDSAVACHPGALARLVVPAAPHNAARVRLAPSLGWAVVYAEKGLQPADAYRARNRLVIVEYTDVLLAFPTSPRPYRSGEWMTIRYAHRAGREVRVYPLNRAPPWTIPSQPQLPGAALLPRGL